MATKHLGCPAKNASSCPRRSFLRKTTAPDGSAPCAWKIAFARSRPIVLTSPTDASFAVVCSTPPLWHLDAVGGVHPIGLERSTEQRERRGWAQSGRDGIWSFTQHELSRQRG